MSVVGGEEFVSPLALVSPALSMASSICGHYHVNRPIGKNGEKTELRIV